MADPFHDQLEFRKGFIYGLGSGRPGEVRKHVIPEVVTVTLWEEYSADHPGGAYRYSQFCLHYHRFRESLKRSMRQVHRAGDKLFIDYSGATVPVIDVKTGEIRRAEIFVAVLGASSYVYAEAT